MKTDESDPVTDTDITPEPTDLTDPTEAQSSDITVPADRVWVMGDHRSDSEDSRFHDPAGDGTDGSVPVDRVTGRAMAVVWPFTRFAWLSDYQAAFAGVPSATPQP